MPPNLLAAFHLSNHIDVSGIDWPKAILLVVALLAAAAVTCIVASLYYSRRGK